MFSESSATVPPTEPTEPTEPRVLKPSCSTVTEIFMFLSSASGCSLSVGHFGGNGDWLTAFWANFKYCHDDSFSDWADEPLQSAGGTLGSVIISVSCAIKSQLGAKSQLASSKGLLILVFIIFFHSLHKPATLVQIHTQHRGGAGPWWRLMGSVQATLAANQVRFPGTGFDTSLRPAEQDWCCLQHGHKHTCSSYGGNRSVQQLLCTKSEFVLTHRETMELFLGLKFVLHVFSACRTFGKPVGSLWNAVRLSPVCMDTMYLTCTSGGWSCSAPWNN